jgi:integrase
LLPAPQTIPFPTLRQAQLSPDLPFEPSETITLRSYYARVLLPELLAEEQAHKSIQSDWCAIRRWEELTPDRDLRDIGRDDLLAFRDRLAARGRSPATINCYWREVKAVFEDAVYRGLLPRVPALGRRQKSRLVKEPPKRQRKPLTETELTQLWRNCSAATYPAGRQFPAPLLWRVALMLFWTYGARTLDMLRALTWPSIDLDARLLRFEAMKTSKLQGLPLTDAVVAHLRAIRGRSDRVFPGFDSTGCVLRAGPVKRGYYTTWRRVIGADSFAPPIWLKHFRESMVTRFNALWPDLGAWVAAHYMPGVTAQHYDYPTERIRSAIESAPVPACFAEVG